MAEVQLKVSGMACSGCADSVTKAIEKVAPGATVNVDLSAGTVTARNVPSRAVVEAAVIKAGYEVAA